MQAPINYMLEGFNPLEAFKDGFGMANDFQNIQAQIRERKQEQDHRQAFAKELNSLDLNNQEAMSQFVARYPKLSKGIQDRLAMMSEKQQKSLIGDTSKVVSLLQSGESGYAVNMLREKAKMFAQSGNIELAQAYAKNASLIEQNQQAGLRALSVDLAVMQPKLGANLKALNEANASKIINVDGGDKQYLVSQDNYTGELGVNPYEIQKGVSPDKKYATDVGYQESVLDNQTKLDVANINAQNALDVANTRGQYDVKTTQMNNELEKEKFNYEAQEKRRLENKGKTMHFGGKAWTVYTLADGRQVAEPLRDKNGQQIVDTAKLNANGSKPLTESQAKNKYFGERMQSANEILEELEGEKGGGVTRGSLLSHMGAETVGNILPSILGGNSKEQQKYIQAKRDFINAVLRKESGAVINEEEFENAEKQYFAQVGDTKEVINQKRANRRRATQLILSSLANGGGGNDSTSTNTTLKVGKKELDVSDLIR